LFDFVRVISLVLYRLSNDINISTIGNKTLTSQF